MNRLVFVVLVAASCHPSVPLALGEESQSAKERTDPRTDYMMDQCTDYVGLRVSDKTKLTCLAKPLLKWTNPSLNIDHGLYVAWTDPDGRPAAVAQIYLAPWSNKWCIEHQSLDSSPLEFQSKSNSSWLPRRAGIEWNKFVGKKIPKPSSSKVIRLAQMRSLARRFHADDSIADNSKLRLLTTPLYRYDAEKAGIIDGALFVMTNGTDPEITLQIEVRGSQDSQRPAFYWAMSPMTTYELSSDFDGVRVWNSSRERPTGPREVFHPHELTVQFGRQPSRSP